MRRARFEFYQHVFRQIDRGYCLLLFAVMFNLRDLIFSQSQSQESSRSSEPTPTSYSSSSTGPSITSKPLHRASPSTSRKASSSSETNNRTVSSITKQDYKVDEYSGHQHEEENVRRNPSKKRGSKYLGDTPLLRKGARKFSRIYQAAPELAFIKTDAENSDNKQGPINEVRVCLYLLAWLTLISALLKA